ncbi:MAG: RcnB family protein [Caulobacter sp.]
MKKFLIGAVALTVLAGAGAASAQPYNPVAKQRQDVREARQDLREERRELKQAQRYERRAERRYRAGRYVPPRGYQARRWTRGQALPASYPTRAYYVDYRAYRLAPPPRGYQYVRVGNDVVLTAIASGVIASVILGLFE